MKTIDRLYKEQYRPLFNVAMKMLSDEVVAHDILQDVFLSFFEIQKRKNDIANPKSYLLRATLNKCIDHNNREGRLVKLNGKELPTQPIFEDSKDEKEAVRIAMSIMNENDRKLLVLYSEGYSYKEIAEMLKIRLSSVGKTLSRALFKMKEELKKLDYELS